MRLCKAVVLAAIVATCAACGGEQADQNDDPTADIGVDDDIGDSADSGPSDEDADEPGGPTYHRDIAPLMADNCTSCHRPDAIAPFSLQTFEEVKAAATISHGAMSAGIMPPWPPDDACGPGFQGHRGMSDAEIERFGEWIAADHPEGDPADAPDDEPSPSPLDGRDPDLTLDIGLDYKPAPRDGGVDDYRCFVVDPQTDTDRFVNLVDTRPGNAEQVHHVIAYMVSGQDELDEVDMLEAQDGEPGYTCFGGPKVSSEMLAGWVPGSTPFPYEDGYGVRLQAGAKLVVQMHYNTLNDPDGTDRTEFDLYFVDEDDHPDPVELVMVPLGQYDLFIPAGDPDAVAEAEGPEVPLPLTLHGIAPHMHTLGTQIRVQAQTGGGDMCLVDIPDWDFNWQGFYLYDEPIELQPPIQTKLTCHYDNSPANQPEGRTPRDVTWGDGTFDEMCLVYFIIERPPGF